MIEKETCERKRPLRQRGTIGGRLPAETVAHGWAPGGGGSLNASAFWQHDPVTREDWLQSGGRKLARTRRGGPRRQPASARCVKPQRIERANRRHDALQKRNAGGLLR